MADPGDQWALWMWQAGVVVPYPWPDHRRTPTVNQATTLQRNDRGITPQRYHRPGSHGHLGLLKRLGGTPSKWYKHKYIQDVSKSSFVLTQEKHNGIQYTLSIPHRQYHIQLFWLSVFLFYLSFVCRLPSCHPMYYKLLIGSSLAWMTR